MIEEPIGQYFVWNKSAQAPRHAHESLESAIAEAKRLAQLNPGKKFIVQLWLGKYSVPLELAEAGGTPA